MHPGRRCSPCRAWTAGSGPDRSRIRGRLLREWPPTCTVTSTAAGSLAGRPATSSTRASTPPAEPPIASTPSGERMAAAFPIGTVVIPPDVSGARGGYAPAPDGNAVFGGRVTQPDPAFEALLEHLKTSRGFDFTGYKRSSLMR